MPLDILANWAASAEYIIAADGGANRLLACGVEPQLTVGDLDSLRSDRPLRILEVLDQDRSDCDKLLAQVQTEGHEAVTLVGVEGDRFDHMLGTISSCFATPLRVRLVLSGGFGYTISGATELKFRSAPGDVVSLIPLADCEDAWLEGVQWPLAGHHLEMGGLVSLSNRAIGDTVSVRVGKGKALLTIAGPSHVSPSWAWPGLF